MPDTPDGLGNIAGIFTLPEWAAYQGNIVSDYKDGTLKDWGQYTYLEYTVAAGKTLYITAWTGANFAGASADAGANQFCEAHIDDSTAGTTFMAIGGNGGFYVIFTPPIIIPAAHKMRTEILNRAPHACNQRISWLGYLI